ncbi:FAD-dependent oxidoreductase [bacterium]|nr:FAD-dependent oxidoreductase [bacterium]
MFFYYITANNKSMDMKSIWETSLKTQEKEYDFLKSDIRRDIVVIGSGISGILTAFGLTEQGYKVTLVEAEKLYGGVTSKTTAHICSQQGYIYYDLKKNKPEGWAKLYFSSQQQAIDEYEKLIKREKIDCGFERVNDYFFTEKNLQKLKELYGILKDIGAKVKFYDSKSVLGFDTKGVIKAENQAMFNPLEFLAQLKKIFEIFESTRILKIDMKSKILYTKKYQIKANKIIIATNYPIVKLKGAYFLKLYKSHSYAVASKEIEKSLNGIYNSDVDNGFTFREFNNKIIIGGLDHRTGRVNNNFKKQKLKEIAKECFNAEITNYWNANDVITYDGLPIVGRFSKKYKDVYIITGFNKWGMANSMASSLLITNLIAGKQNGFEKIFSPQRFNFRLGAFLSNLYVSIKNLIITPLIPAFKSYKNLKAGEGKIVCYNGAKKAVYKDDKGVYHICSPYCKHLHCQLKFNSNSKTWDCPCHGSRYDIDGNIITSPTVEKLDEN